ncbi:MAG TPA: NIPSNAP family protein [Caulobacteraceae bacterium]|nr:NIPSNAP family protein [Caulobacteraceae bacterium]
MITCFIRYDIDPFRPEAFEAYARAWGQIIPRCGGDLVGYWGPHEGSATLGLAAINFDGLGDYEAYRARIRADAEGKANFDFARREGFIRREDRLFLRHVSAPHAPFVKG